MSIIAIGRFDAGFEQCLLLLRDSENMPDIIMAGPRCLEETRTPRSRNSQIEVAVCPGTNARFKTYGLMSLEPRPKRSPPHRAYSPPDGSKFKVVGFVISFLCTAQSLPIGSIVVPFWEYLIGSQICTTNRNYNGA